MRTLLQVFSRKGIEFEKYKYRSVESNLGKVFKHGFNVEYEGFQSGKELDTLIKLFHKFNYSIPMFQTDPLALVRSYDFRKPIVGLKL